MEHSLRARNRRFPAGIVLGTLSVLIGGGAVAGLGCSSGVPPADGPTVNDRSTQAKTDVPPAPIQTAPAQPTPSQTAAPVPTPTAPAKPAPTSSTPPPVPTPSATPPPVPTPSIKAPPPPTASTPPKPPPPLPPIQSIGVTPPSCVLKGTTAVAKDTQLYDHPTGGRVIANFSGNNVPMALSEIPADPMKDRVKLATSASSGAVRIEGYVSPAAIPVFTTRDLPVMAGNVWISSAHKVKLAAATSSSVSVDLTVAGSRNQNVRAATTCDALALQRGTPTPIDIPGNGRAYLTKVPDINIYNQANGDMIFSLQMLEGASQLFWSTETRAGFVHVRGRADLTIDGWVRYTDLDPVKQGERVDQYVPPQTQVAGAQLAIENPPRVAKATKDIIIRARRDERERPIGVVEAGAEIYVVETVAGWTNVLPKELYVLPPDNGGFWILSSETPN